MASSGKEFVIPMHPEDLQNEAQDARIWVSNFEKVHHMEPSEVATRITQVSKLLDFQDGGCDEESLEACISAEAFDFAYSLAVCFEDLEVALQRKALDLVCGALSSVVAVAEAVPSADGLRNALKMYSLLVSWITIAMAKQSKRQIAVAGGTKKKKKGGSSAIMDWEKLVETRGLAVLVQAMEVDVEKAWAPEPIEDEFLSIFVKTITDVLENIACARNPGVRDHCATMLTAVYDRSAAVGSITTSLLHLLNRHEHVPAPLAAVVATVSSASDGGAAVGLAGELLREIGRDLDASGGGQRDAGAQRNVGGFLAELAELMPREVLANVSVLLPCLGCEAYQLRSGIATAFGHLITSIQAEAAAAESNGAAGGGSIDVAGGAGSTTQATRDSLLDVLFERFEDSNAFTRSRVCQTWAMLVRESAVPQRRLAAVAEMAVTRATDKSSHVRKSAMQLLSVLIELNPFRDCLDARVRAAEFETLRGERIARNQAAADKAKASVMTKKKTAVMQKKKIFEQVDDEEDEEEEEEEELKDEDEDEDEDEDNNEGEPSPEEIAAADAFRFTRVLEEGMSSVSLLLQSTIASDVLEVLQLYRAAKAVNIAGSSQGLVRALKLIWSQDPNISDAVIDTYHRLYLDPDKFAVVADKGHSRIFALGAARQLARLLRTIDLGDMTSLERLVGALVSRELMPTSVIEALWDMAAMRAPKSTRRESVHALVLLTFAAQASPNVIRSHVQVLMAAAASDNDILRLRWVFAALQGLNASPSARKGLLKKGAAAGETSKKATRIKLVHTHAIFGRMVDLCASRPDVQDRDAWYAAAEQAINAIFAISDNPQAVSRRIIESLAADGAAVSQFRLSQLLFISGHVALKQLVYMEKAAAVVRRDALQGRSKKSSKTRSSAADSAQSDEEDEGMGTATDVQQLEQNLEEMLKAAERDLVGRSGVLGSVVPIVHAVAVNEGGKYGDAKLRAAAVLTLAKFMCIDAGFCDNNLRLLFSLLKTERSAAVRTNIVVALGDLAFRFPNELEPWWPTMYECLRDPDTCVRRHAVLVMSHLILNDMVKAKGPMTELAMCTEDEDHRVAGAATLFFQELAQKGSAAPIYNHLPDVISKLSASKEVQSEAFRRILAFLLSFITKEKHADTLLDKLCHRMQATADPQQWRDVAYCMSQLKISERGFRKFSESFKAYADKTWDDDVHSSIVAVADKMKRFTNAESRAALEDFMTKLGDARERAVEDHRASTKASRAAKKDGDAHTTVNEEEEKQLVEDLLKAREEAEAEAAENEGMDKPRRGAQQAALKKPKKGAARQATRRQARKKRAAAEDSDDDDESDIEVSDASDDAFDFSEKETSKQGRGSGRGRDKENLRQNAAQSNGGSTAPSKSTSRSRSGARSRYQLTALDDSDDE